MRQIKLKSAGTRGTIPRKEIRNALKKISERIKMEKPKEIEGFNTTPHVEYPEKLEYTWLEVIELFIDLFEEIKHGDQEHQDWLRDKIKDFVALKLK